MITEELELIGRFGKAHGALGEITLHTALDDETLLAAPFLAVAIDGIPTPFFIEELRRKNSKSLYLRLDNVATEAQALRLAGRDCFIAKDSLSPLTRDIFSPREAIATPELLTTPTVRTSPDGAPIGTLSSVDETTINTLLIVETADGSEALIPAAFITGVNNEKNEIYVSLPDGLLEL
jgi:16S rRNA processing protein RimM